MSLSTPRLNPDRLQSAYTLLHEAVAAGELPTALLAVADSHEMLRCEVFSSDGAMGTDGIYLVASISKPIVATAVMQLVEQGRLLIEDPVSTYIPEFAVNGKQAVTVWNLLTHTSGMSDDYWHQPDVEPSREADLRGAIATSLRFPPGSRVEYCTVAFTILGELIHRRTGLPYERYLEGRVFGAAGMVDTSFRPEAGKRSRVLPVPDFPEVPGGMEGYMSLALPGGGLFSPAADLVAFGQSFLREGMGKHGRVLGTAALRTMTALHTEGLCSYENGTPKPEYWGLSWEKASPREGRLVSPSGFGHGGMTGAYLWIDPEAGLVIVFLTNRVEWDRRARKRIVNAVMAAVES